MELESNTPLFAVTSVKVPLPLLRNSHERRAPVGLRRAVRLVPAVEAAEHVRVGRPADVVADEQIEQAVAIEIDPDRGRAERLPRVEAAALRDVDEPALAGIAEQAVLTDAGHQQVGEPVVVPVADRHAHPVHLDIQARGARDVRERAVAVVAIEREGRSLPGVAGPIHAVDEQDVLPAVGVVIQEGAPGAERFRQELAAVCAAVVRECDARRRRSRLSGESRAPVRPAPPATTRRQALARAESRAARRTGRRGTSGGSRQVHQAVADGVDDELGGLVDPERVHDVGAVHGDRVDAQLERGGDLAVGLAVADELQHLQLARCQDRSGDRL